MKLITPWPQMLGVEPEEGVQTDHAGNWVAVEIVISPSRTIEWQVTFDSKEALMKNLQTP
jgi:hypothetical protein